MIEKVFLTPEKDRIRTRRYNHSARGVEMREQYKLRNAEKIKEYNRLYFEKRVARAKLLGLCIVCLRPKQQRDKASCNSCLKKIALNSKRYKERHNSVS